MKYASQVVPILKRYGVVEAALFGSVARGDDTEKSDVDILVRIGKTMTLMDFVGLKVELEERLGKRVDLVQYDKIKPILKPYIMRNVLPLIL